MAPLIGIVPLIDYEKESLWMLPEYMEGVIAAGGIPIMLPLTDDPDIISRLAEQFDGFLFSGGQDVSPELYGEQKMSECGECSFERDKMEKLLLKEVWKADKPILGICRGIQLINVLMGGSLYQDISSQYPTGIEHHMSPPYDAVSHQVTILENTPLFKMTSISAMGVNSYHHQAVKKLAPGLKPMAISEDGFIEALYIPEKTFAMAVQWHPEFSYKKDRKSRILLEEFVAAAQKKKIEK